MIFSFFKRKPPPAGRSGRLAGPATRARGGALPEGPAAADPATTVLTQPSDPRELARLTAAKIDAIESEMMQGAPSSRPARSGVAGSVFVPSGQAEPKPVTPRETAAASGSPGLGAGLPPGLERAQPHEARIDLEFAPLRGPLAGSAAGLAGSEFRGASAVDFPSPDGVLAEPLPDALAVDVLSSSLPPAFEEAAVLFSNGQSDEASAILRAALHDASLGTHARQAWGMLFHLYQCRGEREAFESLADAFSQRFESSPPAWDEALTEALPSAPAVGAPAVVALAPQLDAQAVRQLDQLRRLAQRDRPLVLDVSAVSQVDPLGAELLLRVMATLTRSGRDLTVSGAQSLLDVVGTTTQAGRRDPSDACWMLQLELLRLLGRQQAFEDLSIEYCVTYEVSPPSWEPLAPTLRAASGPLTRPTKEAAPGKAGVCVSTEGVAVSGELLGRIQELVSALREYALTHPTISVDCLGLRRIDFAAAGELLNEIVALREQGKYLRFKDVNHLVGALMAVMGIPDLAEVRLRRI